MKTFPKIALFSLIFYFAEVFSSSNAFFIESKSDGLVLTVSEQKIPPTGPYERNGVLLQEARKNCLEQQWNFTELLFNNNNRNEGFIFGYGNNAISEGLLGKDQYGFYNIYDIGTMIGDRGYRLLRVVPVSSSHARCVKNPGQGGCYQEVECNKNDDSQLWRFI